MWVSKNPSPNSHPSLEWTPLAASHINCTRHHIKSVRLESISPRLSTQVRGKWGREVGQSRSGHPIWTWAAFLSPPTPNFANSRMRPSACEEMQLKSQRGCSYDDWTWDQKCTPNGCGNPGDRQMQSWMKDCIMCGMEPTRREVSQISCWRKTNVGRKWNLECREC